MLTEFFRWPWICSVCYYLFVLFLQAILLSVVLQIMASDSPCSIFKLFLWLSAWQCRPGLFIYCHLYIFVSCFLVFSIVNSSTISHDTQRGGGAKWRHIIQYLRQQNIQDIIIKLTYFHSSSKIKKLWLTSQDTSPLLNKVTRAPSYILIGQTRSANSSHGLPKYLMIHLPFCSINVACWVTTLVFNSKFNQLLFIVLASLIRRGNLSTWRNIKSATCHPYFHNSKAQPIKLDDWFWQPCWIWNWHQKQKLVLRSVKWLHTSFRDDINILWR